MFDSTVSEYGVHASIIGQSHNLFSMLSIILCFAGDDVKAKKPDPSIYFTAARVVKNTWVSFSLVAFFHESCLAYVISCYTETLNICQPETWCAREELLGGGG